MKNSQKRQYEIVGVDCAHCALEIESEIQKIEGIKHASFQFVTGKLKLELVENADLSKILQHSTVIIKKHEPNAELRDIFTDSKYILKYKLNKKLSETDAIEFIEGVYEIPGVSGAHLDKDFQSVNVEYIHDANWRRIHSDMLAWAILKDLQYTKTSGVLEMQKQRMYDMKIRIIFSIGIILYAVALILSDLIWKVALYLLAYGLLGGSVLKKTFRNFRHGNIMDENFLMTIATIGAFFIGEYAEGVAVMLFYQIGEFFQDHAVNRSRSSIQALLEVRPDFANLKQGDQILKVLPSSIKVGDVIVVRPGERVPLDGVVEDGESYLDVSALTGEIKAYPIKRDTQVLSGSINKQGVFSMKVEKEWQDSTMTRILHMVEEASEKKAKTERFITRFAAVYTPIVVVLAVFLATIPPLLFENQLFSEWLYRALVFLVISCPCALVVSIPLGFFGGIGGASKKGILFKNGTALEGLAEAKVIAFDKTGTVTNGSFEVLEVEARKPYNENQVLEFAAIAEMYSTHPIAKAIFKKYGKKPDAVNVIDYEEHPGRGICVIYANQKILVGNDRWMKENLVSLPDINITDTILFVAIEGTYAGLIRIGDTIKPHSDEAILNLKAMGIKKMVMLTGDTIDSAKSVCEKLHIDSYHAELLPQDKVKKIEELLQSTQKNGKVVFVGDGINDAPVLARADIGVAMGGIGSDAAIESAEVVIMNDQITKLPEAIRLARKTKYIVRQNIALAFGVKGIVLFLGAEGIASMWEAVIADVGVTLLAVLNSARAIGKSS